MTKRYGQITIDVRTALAAYVRPYLDSAAKKQAAIKATGLPKGTVDGMIYRSGGGISSWQKLLTYVFRISDNQLDAILTEIKEVLRKRVKLSKGQLLWSKVGDELTEDERVFFAELALAHKRLKPPFVLKRKGK